MCARQLIEAGFEYVTEIDNIKIFTKRKWLHFGIHLKLYGLFLKSYKLEMPSAIPLFFLWDFTAVF